MADENPHESVHGLWRWVVLAALLLASLAAYYIYAPRVPPVISPAQEVGGS
jgi:uncharacterized BrkB/YihY/UPF0761 family membrane protein